MAIYTLPVSNQGSWTPGTDVGVLGGVAQYQTARTNLIDVTEAPYNADNTGAVDCSAAVEAAIAAASADDVVWFPAGTFLVEATIAVDKDNITIRGAGKALTTIIVNNSDAVTAFRRCFNVTGGGSFYAPDLFETVTGTKTKDTSVLGVADTSNFSVGDFWHVMVEDEADTTRINAGAPPTWDARERGFAREMVVEITAIDPGVSVTINPPLHIDCTNYEVKLSSRDVLHANKISGIGIEDIRFEPGNTHYVNCIEIYFSKNCWVTGCYFHYSNTTSSGQCVKVSGSLRPEIRENTFYATEDSDCDGFVNYYDNSRPLFENNVASGNWATGFYSSGSNIRGAILFNFIDGEGKAFLVSHGETLGSHDTLMLYEGNVGARLQADSYWCGSHYNTVFRNWLHGCRADGTPVAPSTALYTLGLNRFTRNYAVVGNVQGWDGKRDSVIHYGYPFIGAGTYHEGYAGPTGASSDPNAAVGDYWDAWGITGIITTRTSDSEAVITTSDGSVFVVGQFCYIFWDSGGELLSSRVAANPSAIDGNDVTFDGGSGDAFPAVSTEVSFNLGPLSYPERDLDVEASSEIVHNYECDGDGTGAATDVTADTLPDSLAYVSDPDWWGDNGFVGAWPPVDPDNPKFSVAIVPAGARYLGVTAPPPNAPTGLTITAT